MAFNPSATIAERHYLVEMYLDATTIRLADQDLSMQSGAFTGFFYEGRLSQNAHVRRSLGSLLQTKESTDNFVLNIDNRDGYVKNLLNVNTNANTLGNREVCVFIGEGSTKTNYATLFPGRVLSPKGVSFDEDNIKVVLVDRRIGDRKILPASDQVFNTADHPNLEARSVGKAIPIVYGSWSSTAGDTSIRIPAICVDTSGLSFQIAGHRIHKLEKVFHNNGEIFDGIQYNNVSLDKATFELLIPYNATSDKVDVNVLGIPSGIGTNVSIHSSPGGILRNILTSYMGLTTTNINVSAFDALNDKTALNGVNNVRRYINDRTSTEDLIAQLGIEAGIDMRFDNQGRYSPKFRDLDIPDERKFITESDIILQSSQTESEKADYSVELDTDRIFANRITSNFAYDPVNNLFSDSLAASSASITELGITVERRLDFNWLFQKTEVTNRVNREIAQFGDNETININVQLSPRFLLANPADTIDVTFDQFVNKVFQIRDMTIDLGSMTTKLRAVDIAPLNCGFWTLDAAPNWNTASAADKLIAGYWCDDFGFASTTDTTSRSVSRWC